MTPFEEFITAHADADTSALLLARSKWPDIDIDLAVSTIEGRRRIRTKLPRWFADTSLVYPTRLCTEQCSSEKTAALKARIITGRIAGGPVRVADLTGGLGVDCEAFARAGCEVLYNEMEPALSDAARHNFKVLGVSALIRSSEVLPGIVSDILDGFVPDIFFLDPARRAADGRKVFRLEDCRPDILRLRDELFGICRHILVKLSPMADISLIASQLGCVREVHVVAAGGECKELLVWMDRGHLAAEYKLICWESSLSGFVSFEADSSAEASSEAVFCSGPDAVSGWLFEPGKSLTKAGLFKTLSQRLALSKLGVSTHLYVTGSPTDELRSLGKLFRIGQVLPMTSRTLKEAGRIIGEGEVSSHNVPISSDALRKRLGVKPSPTAHIFAAHLDLPSSNILIVTHK